MLINGDLVEGCGDVVDILDLVMVGLIIMVREVGFDQFEVVVRGVVEVFEMFLVILLVELFVFFLQIVDVIVVNSQEFVEFESFDVGKLWLLVYDDEMLLIIDVFCFFVGVVWIMMGFVVGEYVVGYILMIRWDLVGLVVVIVFWNYFLMMVFWKLVVLIVVGCFVVLKLFELILFLILKFVEFLQDVVFKGLVNVIYGCGFVIGDQLINSLEMEVIMVIGLFVMGMVVMWVVFKQICYVYLELGGKVFVIVFEDVDLDVVVEVI